MLPKIYKEFSIIYNNINSKETREYIKGDNNTIIIPNDAYNYYHQCANIIFMKISDIICHDIGFHYSVNLRIENLDCLALGRYEFYSNCIYIYLCNIINKNLYITGRYDHKLDCFNGSKCTIDHISTLSSIIYIMAHEFMHSLLYMLFQEEENIVDMNVFKFLSKHKQIFDLMIKNSIYNNSYLYTGKMNFYNFDIERFTDSSIYLNSAIELNDPRLDYKNISKEKLIMDILQRIAIPCSTLYTNLIVKNVILDINLDMIKQKHYQCSTDNFNFILKNNGEYNLDFLPLLNTIIYQTVCNNTIISYNFVFENKDSIRLILNIKLLNQSPIEFPRYKKCIFDEDEED